MQLKKSKKLEEVRNPIAMELLGEEDNAKARPSANFFTAFAAYTTAHGLARLTSSTRGNFGRLLWVIFIIGAYAGLSLHSMLLISTFINQPRSTKLDPNIDFKYPDVYLCNTNPVSYSKSLEPILNTGRYASVYSATAMQDFMRLLRKEVENPRETKQVTALRTEALKWQRNITDAMLQYNHGMEFEGALSEALVYNPETLEARRVRCIKWDQAKRELGSSLNASLINMSKHSPDWNHSRCAAPPFDYWTVHAFKTAIGSTNSLIHAITFESQGPGCFHKSESGQIDFDYCATPVCAMNNRPETECVTQESNKPIYMGNISMSKSGKPCLNWADFQANRLDAHFKNLNANFQYKVFLPEVDNVSLARNTCRSAVVFFKDGGQRQWKSDSSLFIDGEEMTVEEESQPWCLVAGQGSNLSKEFCAIHSCGNHIVKMHAREDVQANNIQSIYGVMHVKYKPHVLSKLLGHESRTEILDCHFGSVKCTSADFETVHHPYYGACYKFNSDRFLRGLSPKQQARRKLNIRLFADDHSYRGQSTLSYEHTKGIVSGPASREELRQAGYYVFILPRDHFPAIGQAYMANTGSHSEFKIAYERSKRVPTKEANCLTPSASEEQYVEYFIPSWSSEGRPMHDAEGQARQAQSMDFLDPFYSEFTNLTKWFRITQETCINHYILSRFIQRCGCLPYFLPIPSNYLKHPWCYQWNTSGTDDYGPAMRRLIRDDACSADLVNSLEDISSEGWTFCTANCEIERYNTQQINKYWPDIFYHGFMTTLGKLLSLKGFPKTVSPELGLSMLFYTYEEARSILSSSNATVVQTMQQMIDAARSNLVWITIGSALEYGLMTEEELSYTANNLLAEIGGALGLWCGISLLTFCELLELAGYLCTSYWRRILRRLLADNWRPAAGNHRSSDRTGLEDRLDMETVAQPLRKT